MKKVEKELAIKVHLEVGDDATNEDVDKLINNAIERFANSFGKSLKKINVKTK